MNAPATARHFAPAAMLVQGRRLFRGFQMTDALQLDLYGHVCPDHGHVVESVAPVGSLADISELLGKANLDGMGEWLDAMASSDSAETARAFSKATRLAYLP